MRRKSSSYIKITSLFTKSIVLILVIIFIVDMLTMIRLTEYRPTLTQDPAQFTNDIGKYIKVKDAKPYIDERGKNILKEQNAWIQIVDNKLEEEYSYKKPKNVPIKYSPIEFVHVYKYDTVNSTLFIGEKSFEGQNKFSYFIGFPINKIAKYNLEYNPHNLKEIIGGGILIILAINLIIILIFGYVYFARKIGKPLEKVLIYIEKLSSGNYKINEKEKGIYKYVFKNLNVLSKVLMDNRDRKKKIDQLRDQWISSISHDMKTPLSSIKGFSEILKDDDYEFAKDEIIDYAGIIYDKALYMEELINDLNFSYKLRNNCITINKKKVYFSKWLNNIIYTLHSSPEFKDRNVKISNIDENIVINIDELMMKRAFVNIITNFLMYNDNNSIIEIFVEKSEEFIKVGIKDNGKGIPEKDIDHIFERYYRGTNTTSNSKGSGLGMAIANDIIKLHDGVCNVKSKEGEGTEFTVFLKEN
ncbi:sensor histidine kinase [Clostridium felsineum]|uniref:sensor histidine kinase n=1 Tax=Clostridium felsineum TaxID=36839 RepID=UPI00098C4C64|nr:HAMP domain-containing sensor histidine kinase [Clostridium felsineum]URZ18222.1 Adaptive-response sensory-kinase SasA [Clostridium felsineum DSM 794]